VKTFKSYVDDFIVEEFVGEENKPTDPEKWARAKSAAKSKFAVYPSAYANAWASKKYKSMGGGWKSTKEEYELEEEQDPTVHNNDIKAALRDKGIENVQSKDINHYEKGAVISHNGYHSWHPKHGVKSHSDLSTAIKYLHKEEVELDEDKSPAWTRSAGKDPEGGLNRKGVASYRRENPGSKLKMAVTTKPSKLDPDSKPAKRRKSFCARMGGMKKRLTSSKTANDPDSRINKALRKWNC